MSDDHERAEAEALQWLIRLRERPDDAECRVQFERWRKASPAHDAAWTESARIYAAIGNLTPVFVRPSARPRRILQLVVAGGLAAALAIIILPEVLLHLRADVVTGTGELREVRLQDGSLASVAPGSAIEIAYSEDERRIRLLRGAALFDVTRDAARPFRVEAAETTTHVLGTAFEVALPETSAEVTVAVVRGVVRVGKQALTETLTAGQGLRVAAHGKVTREHTSPERIAAWRTGRMEVEDASVADVVAALRPWYIGKILLASDRLGKARVTGVYNLRDAASALAALAQAHGGRARQVTPWLIILSEF